MTLTSKQEDDMLEQGIEETFELDEAKEARANDMIKYDELEME